MAAAGLLLAAAAVAAEAGDGTAASTSSPKAPANKDAGKRSAGVADVDLQRLPGEGVWEITELAVDDSELRIGLGYERLEGSGWRGRGAVGDASLLHRLAAADQPNRGRRGAFGSLALPLHDDFQVDLSLGRDPFVYTREGAHAAREERLGAVWGPTDALSLSVEYSRTELKQLDNGELAAQDALTHGYADPGALAAALPAGAGSEGLAGEREGLDLAVAYDLDAGLVGDLELSFQLSGVFERRRQADGEVHVSDSLEPVAQHAEVGFSWNRGSFRGSLTSRFVERLDGESDDPRSWATLDINIGWKTPWDGSVSVGAKNVLGQDSSMTENLGDNGTLSRFDDVFGRIPYVRYEQDL